MSEQEPHPDADEERERLESQLEAKQDELERLERGEVVLPWPHHSREVLIMGIFNLVTAGALLVVGGDALILAALIVATSGVMLVILARWLHKHFEMDPQPRYTTVATDGGDA